MVIGQYSRAVSNQEQVMLACVRYNKRFLRSSISWSQKQKQKLYPDLALGNSLYLCRCKPKSEKKLFSGLPCPQKLSQVPSMPKNLEKVQIYPKPVKCAILFRANPAIILLQVNPLILNNLHYILLALWKPETNRETFGLGFL